MAAQEEERARIGRDVHHNICQQLSVLASDLYFFKSRLMQSGEVAPIDAALQKLNVICDDVRDISHRVHPSIIRDLGMVTAMRAECQLLPIEIVSPSGLQSIPM